VAGRCASTAAVAQTSGGGQSSNPTRAEPNRRPGERVFLATPDPVPPARWNFQDESPTRLGLRDSVPGGRPPPLSTENPDSGSPDPLKGTAKADVIATLGGHDTVSAGRGADLVYGSPGNDTLTGGRGPTGSTVSAAKHVLPGGLSNDRLSGRPDRNRLPGGQSKDRPISALSATPASAVPLETGPAPARQGARSEQRPSSSGDDGVQPGPEPRAALPVARGTGKRAEHELSAPAFVEQQKRREQDARQSPSAGGSSTRSTPSGITA
jgi:hypothetical protein